MFDAQKPSFFTLLLLISFASVNAVLFSPALPDIAHFFGISADTAQRTITWYLIAYALGQLVYGPIANRFGRKPAVYAGIILQIVSSFLCVFSGLIHAFWLLVVGRFLLGLGSGVGLKIAFTLVNECYETKMANQKISYLMLAFAITPGLSVALGGILNQYYGWASCFYAGALYGFILLLLATRLPETQKILDLHALKINHLLSAYGSQFKNSQILAGGFLMAGVASFVYVFAALAPFIAITLFGMESAEYGAANILPSLGLMCGSLTGAQLSKKYPMQFIIGCGILICAIGVIILIFTLLLQLPILFSLFFPTMIIFFGSTLIMANASTIAMSSTSDKAHASAVMNFINMGATTVVVLSLGLFPMKTLLLPFVYFVICMAMIGTFKWGIKNAAPSTSAQ